MQFGRSSFCGGGKSIREFRMCVTLCNTCLHSLAGVGVRVGEIRLCNVVDIVSSFHWSCFDSDQ